MSAQPSGNRGPAHRIGLFDWSRGSPCPIPQQPSTQPSYNVRSWAPQPTSSASSPVRYRQNGGRTPKQKTRASESIPPPMRYNRSRPLTGSSSYWQRREPLACGPAREAAKKPIPYSIWASASPWANRGSRWRPANALSWSSMRSQDPAAWLAGWVRCCEATMPTKVRPSSIFRWPCSICESNPICPRCIPRSTRLGQSWSSSMLWST